VYTWSEVVTVCENMGATIGYILNQEEQDALALYMKNINKPIQLSGSCGFWTGLNQRKEQNVWVWEGINEPATFTAWAHGYPEDTSIYDCVWTNYQCDTGKWANWLDCSSPRRAFCRK